MPRIVDRDERRAHIVEAVTQIIVRDGFDRLTMRQIAAEAGYAHGAIARYFPDKQSLLAAAFVRVFTLSHEHIDDLVEGVRGLEALRLMVLELMPIDEEAIGRSRVVLAFWDLASQDPELREIHHENLTRRRALIRRFLLEAQEDGELVAHADIETEVNRVSAHNAGWQMLGVLMPEASGVESLHASVDAMIAELRRAD